MHFISILVALSLTRLARATPLAKTSAATVDWKYAVGWDGVTLSADTIGAPLAGTRDAPAARDNHLEKRAVGGVYLCTDVNWKGRCGYAVQPLNTCIVLGAPWKDGISSFGPDACTHCSAFSRGDCTAPFDGSTTIQPPILEWQFDHPGADDGGLNGGPFPWNDKIESFMCFRSC